MDEQTLQAEASRHEKKWKAIADKVREVAEIIGKRPVLGHWPANRAHLDQQLLILAAGALESLGRDLTQVAALGHKLMADQQSRHSAGANDGK